MVAARTSSGFAIRVALLVTAALGASSVAANASPIPLQGRTITGAAVAANNPTAVFEYDANLNITWLRDWNASPPGAPGAETWSTKMNWAATLTVGTFSGWMLPAFDSSDGNCSNFDLVPPPPQHYGYNCTGSAMGYLWYTELGNTQGEAFASTNKGPFLNVQSGQYWSRTAYAPNTAAAWDFYTNGGLEGADLKTLDLYAVAVRPGDVTAVPEPASLVLLLSGFGVLAYRRRRA